MYRKGHIPFEWQQYPHYFITYYGDIYNGIVVDHMNFPDRLFILSNNQMQEFQKQEKHTLENYQRLCWEIKDHRIIKDAFPANRQNIGTTDGAIDTTRHGDQVWKRMFVFGAGASAYCLFGKDKNSISKAATQPPLGNEIFHDRYSSTLDNFEGAKLSVPYFKANGHDIEGCLEKEWLAIRNSYNPNITARHINLQYYLQTLFEAVSVEVTHRFYDNNLYSLFANKLQKFLSGTDERIALVNFNYDTILDYFIGQIFRYDYKKMADYIDCNKRQIMLFKPHGSCNWGWRVNNSKPLHSRTNQFFKTLYDNNTELWEIYFQLLGDFNEMVHQYAWGIEKSFSKKDIGRYTINKNRIEVINDYNYEYFPALLMPYRDKDEFVMHYDHFHSMQWFTSQMEELYLIGWKGNEDSFNRLLKSQAHRLKKIVIVNPNEKKKKEVSKNLELFFGELRKKYEVIVIDSFEEFVVKEMDKIFISEFANEK